MRRVAQARFQGVSNYVPKMQSVAGLIHGAPMEISLGSPAAVDADEVIVDVDADAVATTRAAASWTSICPYGQTLRVTPSADPGNAFAFNVFGEDWLGQPMGERFTGANGATAILYGKKAFYRVTHTVIVTAATNAIVADVGTGYRLGLPFKGDVGWAKENGIFVPLYKRDFWLWTDVAGASLVGGPSGAWIKAPCAGFVKGINVTASMPVGSTNDPAVTVELGGVAIVGLTATADVSAAATGAEASDVPTTAGYSANNRFRAGDLIELVLSDADAAVGSVRVGIEITPTQYSLPVLTDPQTLLLGDPRGTYEPQLTPDGSEIIIGLTGDPAYNAAGNGGLHGIAHVIA